MTASRRHVTATACLFLGLADLAFLNTVVLPRAWRRAGTVSFEAPARSARPLEVVPVAQAPAAPAAPAAPVAPALPAASPAPTAPTAPAARTSATVFFPPAAHRLDREARQAVEQMAARLKQEQRNTLLVEGHTDRTGEEGFNNRLSRRRAWSVLNYLKGQGVDASRVVIRGFGSTRPLATGDDPGSLQRNRRVEMIVTGGAS